MATVGVKGLTAWSSVTGRFTKLIIVWRGSISTASAAVTHLYATRCNDVFISNPFTRWLDWIVQCFTSPPTQYRLYGRRHHTDSSSTVLERLFLYADGHWCLSGSQLTKDRRHQKGIRSCRIYSRRDQGEKLSQRNYRVPYVRYWCDQARLHYSVLVHFHNGKFLWYKLEFSK